MYFPKALYMKPLVNQNSKGANIIFSRFDFVLLQIVLQEAEIMNQGKTVFAQIMSLILENVKQNQRTVFA